MPMLSNRMPALGESTFPQWAPLQACFGVACLHHHRCARYAAVVDSQASPKTMGTCLSGDVYPLFVEVQVSRPCNPAA